MKRAFAGVGALFLFGASAHAQTLSIEHQPAGCAVVDKFPRLEARFAPAANVAASRILFQGQSPEWYSVAMKPEGAGFVGVLPRPKKSLKSFRYYIEVTDRALATNRTAEFTVDVVDGSGACKGRLMAGALGSASLILQGPVGAAALPAGFASTGVVAGSAAGSSGVAAGAGAGGGGLSATTLGIVGGAVAAGAVVATQVGGDNRATYSGPYSGTLVDNVIRPSQTNPGCSRNDRHSGTVTMDLAVSDSTVAGDGNMAGNSTLVAWIGGCAANPVGEVQSYQCDFTVGGTPASVQGSGGFTNPQNNVRFSCTFAGSLSGDTLTGAITLTIGEPVGQGGSTSFPVTLSKR
jgi:hypothetical protein